MSGYPAQRNAPERLQCEDCRMFTGQDMAPGYRVRRRCYCGALLCRDCYGRHVPHGARPFGEWVPTDPIASEPHIDAWERECARVRRLGLMSIGCHGIQRALRSDADDLIKAKRAIENEARRRGQLWASVVALEREIDHPGLTWLVHEAEFYFHAPFDDSPTNTAHPPPALPPQEDA